jgi:hypothetical protein
MKLYKKNILIGAGILSVSVGIYFWLKNKANHRKIGIIDDENVDFDYSNRQFECFL